ncbi:MAG: mevalonate kinase [Oligoflexus sp.]
MKAVNVQVPGKIMLAGEYAVLHGAPCLSCAVDVRMNIQAQKATAGYTVYSDFWDASWSLDAVPSAFQDNILIQVLQWCRDNWQLPPFDIKVQSDFAVQDGLGSSTALRLGTLAALQNLFALETIETDPWYLPRLVWQMQLKEQSFASGYDVITQFLGSWVEFQADEKNWPGKPQQIAFGHKPNEWIHIYRGGRGAPTKTVGSRTKDWLSEHKLWPDLLNISNELVAIFRQTLSAEQTELKELLPALQQLQNLFLPSPDYPLALHQSLAALPGFQTLWTYKTSGAGGEDAIILIGRQEDLSPAFQSLKNLGWSRLPYALGAERLKITADSPHNFHTNQANVVNNGEPES